MLASSLVYAYKYWETKICRLHQSIHISTVKFTFETSFTEMPTIIDDKSVAQDIKFGEYIVNRTTGNNFDQNNNTYRLFQKVHPIFKFNFD